MQKNKSNFFERILQLLDYYGIKNINTLAKDYLLYDSSEKINRLKDPNKKPSVDILEDFSNTFENLDINWLLTGRGEMLRKDLPVASPSDTGVPLIPIDAIAGIPAGDNLGLRFIDCEHYIVPEFANLNVEYMIRVSGSSMYPKYSNGDILACRRIQDILFFQWGKIYVIDSSQGALVKRVFEDEDPERILLVSDNKEKYPPFSIPKSDIRSVSIVLGVIRLE